MTVDPRTGLNAKETGQIKARLDFIAEELDYLYKQQRRLKAKENGLRQEQSRLNAKIYVA